MKILLLCLVIFSSTTMYAQINYESYLHKSDSLVQLNVGKQFPSFRVLTLKGESISDKDLLGKSRFLISGFNIVSHALLNLMHLIFYIRDSKIIRDFNLSLLQVILLKRQMNL